MSAPITSAIIEQEAHRLADDGWHYTPRQLYHAVCAAVDLPGAGVQTARAEIGCGVILVMAALPVFLAQVLGFLLLLAIGLGLIVAGALALAGERRRPARPRVLAISFDEFMRDYLRRVRDADRVLPGLLDEGALDAPVRAPETGTLIVCDLRETAAMLRANAERLPQGVAVAAEPDLGDDLSGRRAVALHDADPSGCGLAGRLRAAGATDVTDAGLHPPGSDVGLPVAEGAPARVPEEVASSLEPDQADWLRSGRRLELAHLGPRPIVVLLSAALAG